MGDGDVGIPRHFVVELERLALEQGKWLYGYARAEVRGNDELAEDLVQETFIAAARAWRTVRQLSLAEQRAWLRTTLSHKATDDYRHNEVARRLQHDIDTRFAPRTADTVAQALDAIALKRVRNVIESMPGQQRKVAIMRWFEDRKVREIADQLGIAEGTVHAHIHEARRKLITGLGPYYPFGTDSGGGEA